MFNINIYHSHQCNVPAEGGHNNKVTKSLFKRYTNVIELFERKKMKVI